MGVEHGVLCVGCCWALMLLLFVGGVMNLRTIAALTFFVLVEKLSPFGARTGRISAAALAIIAVWILAL
jgi:predicted metal-binding membrane protein